MEILETNTCMSHNLPISTICSCQECDSIFLCDFCLNTHDKNHKYLITTNSLKTNLYDKIIQTNEESSKILEKTLTAKTNEFVNKIEFDFFQIHETFLKLLTKTKNNLIEKVENLKDNFVEESKIWTKLKFDYGRNYMAYMNNLNKSILKTDNFDEKSELNFNNLDDSNYPEMFTRKQSHANNFDMKIYENDFSIDSKFQQKEKFSAENKERKDNRDKEKENDCEYSDIDESLRNLLNSISTVMEKLQIYNRDSNINTNMNLNLASSANNEQLKNQSLNYINDNRKNYEVYKKPKNKNVIDQVNYLNAYNRNNTFMNAECQNNHDHINSNSIIGKSYEEKFLSEFNKSLYNLIDEDFSNLKNYLKQICEEKVLFTNNEKLMKNMNLNLIHNNSLPKDSSLESIQSPTYKNLISPDTLKDSGSRLTYKQIDLKHIRNNNVYNNKTIRYNEINALNRYSTSSHKHEMIQSYENLSITKFNFNPETFNMSECIDVFPEKKDAWYSLEYLEDLDLIVCGYHSGEILIFRETDLTLIRTYRPRFKRIRKLIYSPENSSIFACYDDGHIAVINLTNYKITTYKMSTNQIYAMEIMPNYNILIFGGVEKKIKFSYIIDLNKSLLFYESSIEGEIQSLFYEESSDILVSTMRKSSVMFFKYQTGEVIAKYKLTERDCCGMMIKKFKDDSIMVCGYFMNLHHFRFCENNVIEYVGSISLDVMHIYDFIKMDDRDNYILINTYDEGKLVLVNMKTKKGVKVFDCVKGIIQIKIIKNYCYLTSHTECLKKIKISY